MGLDAAILPWRSSGGDWAGDEDAVTSTCRHDLPLGAAMAEAVTEGGRLWELEDFHSGAVVELEDDHPGAFQAGFEGLPFLRPRLRIAVIV